MNNRRARIVGLIFVATVTLPMAVSADNVDGAPADVIMQFGHTHPQPGGAANNIVAPEEVTINKGGTVTFVVNGGFHGIAIYPVSKQTVREDITEDLCQGCTLTAANNQYFVTDGKGDLIIDTGANPPSNRVDDPLDRLLSAGNGAFLVGSTPTTEGTQVQYRFEKTGRFLVICTNRGHFIIAGMFGFINVVGGDLD